MTLLKYTMSEHFNVTTIFSLNLSTNVPLETIFSVIYGKLNKHLPSSMSAPIFLQKSSIHKHYERWTHVNPKKGYSYKLPTFGSFQL